MNLDHDKEAFAELIAGAANELVIPANVIEKDYIVETMGLSNKLPTLIPEVRVAR